MADVSPRLVHQGVLIKSPPESKSKDLSRWRKRYFRLWSSKTLEYYKSEKSKEILKKPIDLNRCRSIDGDLKNKKWNNIFCLNTIERKFFLVANSPEAMEEWIGKICDVCGFSKAETRSQDGNVKSNVSESSLHSPSNDRRYDAHANALSERSGTSMVDNQILAASLPTYDEPLPNIPDSPRSNHSVSERSSNEEPSTNQSSPYASHIKQTRQNIYMDSPGSCYNNVPLPTPLETEFPIRRMSTPAETAKLNQTIKDESYVDMQPENNVYDPVPPPILANVDHNNQMHSTGTYDLVPLPILANGCTLKSRHSRETYDIVPTPRPAHDEYIDCDIASQEREELLNSQAEHTGMPPIPDPTYTGFDTLPTVGRRSQQSICENNSNDDIYSSPPTKSQFDDSNHGHHQLQGEDCIYDTPPSKDGNLAFSDDSVHSGCNDIGIDSVYDRPPSNVNSPDQDLIYDTPPCHNSTYGEDAIYDIPPASQNMTPAAIYDVPPSPAEIFGFHTKAPAVDRTLKYASTSQIDTRRIFPPTVDRSDRPNLTASVPIFPQDFGSDNIYDQPPTRSEIDQYAGSFDVFTHFNNENPQELASPTKQPQGTLLYSHFNFPSSNEHPVKRTDPRSSTDYSTVDSELTAAVKNARISCNSEHYH